MTYSGVGATIFDMRKRINKITLELKDLNNRSQEIPELIKSANLLRSNEHLLEINSKNSELISAYSQYSKELENMLDTVFEIQNELKDILKTQTSLISEQKVSKKKSIKKKKPSKK